MMQIEQPAVQQCTVPLKTIVC